jgi:hypothetical protein
MLHLFRWAHVALKEVRSAMAQRPASRRSQKGPPQAEAAPAPAAEEPQAQSEVTPLPPAAPPATENAEAAAPPEPAAEQAPAAADEARPALDGRGREVLLTLGDTIGCAVYVDGRHVLDLDLGAHPARKRRSYDEDIGGAARRQLGSKRWSRRVQRALLRVQALLSPRQLYVAGENARRLRGDLPPDTRLLS